VAKNDRTAHPELERFVAKRMGATTVEAASSHVPMLSDPALVLDVIRKAASAVQKPEVGVQLRRPEGRDTPLVVRSASRSMAAIAFASRATCGSRSSCPDTVVPS